MCMESSILVITTENFEPELLWPLLLTLGVLCHLFLRLFERGRWWLPCLSALKQSLVYFFLCGIFKLSADTIHGFSQLKECVSNFTMGIDVVNGLYIDLIDLKCFSFKSLLFPFHQKGIHVCCTFVNIALHINNT
jgi:hypothetical protein